MTIACAVAHAAESSSTFSVTLLEGGKREHLGVYHALPERMPLFVAALKRQWKALGIKGVSRSGSDLTISLYPRSGDGAAVRKGRLMRLMISAKYSA